MEEQTLEEQHILFSIRTQDYRSIALVVILFLFGGNHIVVQETHSFQMETLEIIFPFLIYHKMEDTLV